MNHLQKRALEYVTNTGGRIHKDLFDDDHEPIGPMLRKDLIPDFINEDEDGFLTLVSDDKTEQGT